MGFIDDNEQKRIFSDNLTRYIIMTGKEQKDIANVLFTLKKASNHADFK